MMNSSEVLIYHSKQSFVYNHILQPNPIEILGSIDAFSEVWGCVHPQSVKYLTFFSSEKNQEQNCQHSNIILLKVLLKTFKWKERKRL